MTLEDQIVSASMLKSTSFSFIRSIFFCD